MGLLEVERETYDEMGAVPQYREFSPGVRYLPIFQSLITARRPVSILDAGCCTGKAGLALTQDGCDVTLLDLTDAGLVPEAKVLPFREGCLWHDLSPHGTFDYVYCCDVLEHIPTAFTMLVADQLLRVSRVGAFIAVSLVPDHFGAWVGKPLHQTVQPYLWWKQYLGELGLLMDARDLHTNATFFVRPK
jgi:2-polyprenyl-3-methyl-5-hydroxy-6-metoxy-1,4-benzoquinol methylase